MDFSSGSPRLQQAQKRRNLERQHTLGQEQQREPHTVAVFIFPIRRICESNHTALEIRMHVTLQTHSLNSSHLMDLVHLFNIRLLSTYYVLAAQAVSSRSSKEIKTYQYLKIYYVPDTPHK